MSTSPPTPQPKQPSARSKSQASSRRESATVVARPQSMRLSDPGQNARRRAAKRRAALGQRFRHFEAAMPGLRMEPMRGPAIEGSAIGFTGFVWSKAVSLVLLLGVLFGLIWINADERWYVYPERVQVTGQRLLSATALGESAGVSGWNIFWLRQNEVRDRIVENPWVSSASVSFGLPAQVLVAVDEAPTIGVWSTTQGEFWISSSGAALPTTEAAPPEMARIVDPQMAAARPGSKPGTAIDTSVVASALALMANVPGVTEVRYSPDVGLHFGLPGTTLYVHWGDGEHLTEKLALLRSGRQSAAVGELDGKILDVRFPSVVTIR